MRPRNLVLISVLALGPVIIAVSCWRARPGLDEYCPDDPLAPTCPGSFDCRPYECLSYCVRHDMVGDPASPATGMGSWCHELDDEDVRAVCCANPEVAGCETYEDLDCGGPDGDSDADSDADDDTDGDGDAEGDADGDEGCRSNGDCPDPVFPHCDDSGECVGCTDSELDCGRFDETPHCHGDSGACVECLSDQACRGGDEPSICNLVTHSCVPGCVSCGLDDGCDFSEGLYCVEYRVHSYVAGYDASIKQCMVAVPAGQPLECVRPYRRVSTTSIGEPSIEVHACVPPATASCYALWSLGTDCTPDGVVCGDPDLPEDFYESRCLGLPESTDAICSYHCHEDGDPPALHDEHCPEGYICADESFNTSCLPE